MPDKAKILIVDDDRNTREGLERALKFSYRVYLARDAASALECLGKEEIAVILSDMRMPGLSGLEFLREVREKHPDTIFILLTAYGSVETAVEAMKAGAHDFLTKPVNLDHLDLMIERALGQRSLSKRASELQKQNKALKSQLDEKFSMGNIIGSSAAMQPVFNIIKAAAPTGATVLVTGPSGTGKELVARAIHNLSRRPQGPFIAVNCAALPANLLESELFGHEKGAFTGAESRRQGRFELASDGTLFLDEIGEIDAATQVKLLRVLESRTFERVGGAETIKTDMRLVAATNKDLQKLVAEGKFREDLYYRLAVVDIKLPPLCERKDDIPAMVAAFLKEFSEKNMKEIQSISPAAMERLVAYPWPGNVRELRNTIEKMVVLSSSQNLDAGDLPGNILASARPAAATIASGSLKSTEAEKIAAILAKHSGNRTHAAEELGISRRTLIRKIKEYGLK